MLVIEQLLDGLNALPGMPWIHRWLFVESLNAIMYFIELENGAHISHTVFAHGEPAIWSILRQERNLNA